MGDSDHGLGIWQPGLQVLTQCERLEPMCDLTSPPLSLSICKLDVMMMLRPK